MIPFLVVQQARCTTGPLCQERAKLTYVVFFDTKCDFFWGGGGLLRWHGYLCHQALVFVFLVFHDF